MAGIKYVAEKTKAYFGREGCVKMTPRRMRELRTFLRDIQGIVETNSRGSDEYGEPIFRPSTEDVEAVGGMEFLLNKFFPDGNVPESLKPYIQFVQKVKYFCSEDYGGIVEAKLRRDERILNAAREGRDTLDELDDFVYARAFVGIVEAEEVKPEKSRLIVNYEGDILYEENLPEGVFDGLPIGATVVFDYSVQGLSIDLERTLGESSSAVKKLTDVESPVIEALARHPNTKKYIDDVFDQINSSFQ